jgi:hypothetical protein
LKKEQAGISLPRFRGKRLLSFDDLRGCDYLKKIVK